MMSTKRGLSILVLAGLLVASGCQVAKRRGVRLDLTDFDKATETIDDLIVWPVQERGTGLAPDMLRLMTRALHDGMRDRDYSVLSRTMIDNLADQLGKDDAAAVKALEAKSADGVLVVRITRWDERGLLSLGKIRAEGELKLLGPGGRVRWQGRLHCDAELVDRLTGPRELEARRREVVERIAVFLANRLPRHRI